MVNRYTSDRRIRSDDAYSPGGAPACARTARSSSTRSAAARRSATCRSSSAASRPACAASRTTTTGRTRCAARSWSTRKADLLRLRQRRARHRRDRAPAGGGRRRSPRSRDLRGTAFVRARLARADGWTEIDSTTVDAPGPLAPRPRSVRGRAESRRGAVRDRRDAAPRGSRAAGAAAAAPRAGHDRARTVVRMPVFEQVDGRPGAVRARLARPAPRGQPGQRARAGAAPRRPRRLAQPAAAAAHHAGDGRALRAALHARAAPALRRANDPGLRDDPLLGDDHARLLRRLHLLLDHRARGPHHPEPLRGLDPARDRDASATRRPASPASSPTSAARPPTCTAWPARRREIEAACRMPSCVLPGHLRQPRHRPHAAHPRSTARRARCPGVKKVLVASGVRYDLAVRSPEYVRSWPRHHVGGYLKIAPEHTEDGPLAQDDEAGHRHLRPFKELFDRSSQQAGKKQYLIPYFIAAHPGTTDEDMLELALWLKRNGFRADQVQTFLPSPMATATAMYHTGYNPLRALQPRRACTVSVARAATSAACTRRSCATTIRTTGRCCARRSTRMGRARPDRQRQAPPGPALAAGRHRPQPGRPPQHPRPAPRARHRADPAHRPAPDAGLRFAAPPAPPVGLF